VVQNGTDGADWLAARTVATRSQCGEFESRQAPRAGRNWALDGESVSRVKGNVLLSGGFRPFAGLAG
jgi:hypothetical protein